MLIIILIFASIALLIITPPVQNFIKKKATAWLSSKLNTTVAIGKIYIGFPKKVVLENIYVEDQQKDTLLAGGSVRVDVSMMKLLKSELEINDVQLSEITAKVKRVLPDTVYNFQFIIDAFASGDTTTKSPADTAGMKMSVRDVTLDKIRMVYDDDVTGNDVTLWLEHFDTRLDEFDSDNLRFSVPETNIKGIRANIYQRKPLVEPVEVTEDTTAAPPPAFDIAFGEFNASDINVDYGNDVLAFYTNLNLGALEVNADDLDMQNQVIKLEGIRLDNTTAQIRMGKTEGAKIVEAEVKQEAEQQTKSGWRIEVKEIQVNNNNLAFANENEPVVSKGMDYAHLDARKVTLHAENFVFNPDSIAARITKGQLSEKSGFVLNTLQTDFLYASNQAYLHDLLLETPGTTIRRSAEIKYPSLEALKKDMGKMQLDIDLNNSRIQVKDVLTFAPALATQPAFSNPAAIMDRQWKG